MDEQIETLYAADRQAWREWLQENHQDKKAIWLIYYKKHTGKPRVSYEEAVEEALCFGWIDSIVKRIDEERYMQKFTPRRDTTHWSEANIRRMKSLIARGSMTPVGLEKIPPEILTGEVEPETPPAGRTISMLVELERLLNQNPRARENFDKLAPSHRRNYLGWIGSAKKDETREKRAREAIQLLLQNKKLGLK